jgi:hypothetical protein
MSYLTPYYELGEDAPTLCCASFESVQRFVAENALPLGCRVTLADMARVELVTLYDRRGEEVEAVALDGEVVGSWGEPLAHPIHEYLGAPPVGGEQ